MDFNSLSLQIQNYTNKTSDVNFSNSIVDFIQMGQQRIWREFAGIEFESTVNTGQFISGNATLVKPGDWNKTLSFSYSNITNYSTAANLLKLRTYDFCRQYWPNSSTTDPLNPPEFYSDLGGDSTKFFISPTPDQNYFYELIYLRRVQPLDKDNTTNILTRDYPDLLFYACFLEALTYLRDDERIQIYESNYQRALESAKAKSTDRHADKTLNRDID